jgi:hypothetical protein
MTRFQLVPCCLALVARPVFCFAQSKNLVDVGGSLSGKVLLAEEQRAAAEARVELKLMSGNWTASTFTNSRWGVHFCGAAIWHLSGHGHSTRMRADRRRDTSGFAVHSFAAQIAAKYFAG